MGILWFHRSITLRNLYRSTLKCLHTTIITSSVLDESERSDSMENKVADFALTCPSATKQEGGVSEISLSQLGPICFSWWVTPAQRGTHRSPSSFPFTCTRFFTHTHIFKVRTCPFREIKASCAHIQKQLNVVQQLSQQGNLLWTATLTSPLHLKSPFLSLCFSLSDSVNAFLWLKEIFHFPTLQMSGKKTNFFQFFIIC